MRRKIRFQHAFFHVLCGNQWVRRPSTDACSQHWGFELDFVSSCPELACSSIIGCMILRILDDSIVFFVSLHHQFLFDIASSVQRSFNWLPSAMRHKKLVFWSKKLWMEETLHHLGWLKPYNRMFTTVFNWCRISHPSTVCLHVELPRHPPSRAHPSASCWKSLAKRSKELLIRIGWDTPSTILGDWDEPLLQAPSSAAYS